MASLSFLAFGVPAMGRDPVDSGPDLCSRFYVRLLRLFLRAQKGCEVKLSYWRTGTQSRVNAEDVVLVVGNHKQVVIQGHGRGRITRSSEIRCGTRFGIGARSVQRQKEAGELQMESSAHYCARASGFPPSLFPK